MSAFLPLKANEELRAATRMPGTLPSAVMSSSVIPSEKYSLSRSGLKLVNGSTATEAAAEAAGAAAALVWATGGATVRRPARYIATTTRTVPAAASVSHEVIRGLR